MNRRIWIILTTMMCAGVAMGEDAVLSPGQVVINALAYSLDLKTLDQENQAAEARVQQAKALGLPSIDLEGHAFRYEGLEDSSFGPNSIIPAIDSRYGASIGLTQPLFTGGRISGQKEGARFSRDASALGRQSATADVMLQALSVYWNWSKAYYSVKSSEAAVAWMEAHYADMQVQQNAGLVTENDALSTEVRLEQARLSLENVRGAVRLAQAQITWLTGIEWASNNIPQEAPLPVEQALDLGTDVVTEALSNRLERAARRLELKSAEEQLQVQRAGYYPQLYLTAKYEQARPNMMNIPPQDEWQDDAFAGVAVSWNILDWGLTRSKVAEAGARAEQARIRTRQTDDAIALEARQSRINLEVALRRLSVALRAEDSAKLNLRSASDLWQNGMARHSDVLDARARLTEAEYEVVAARSDVALTRAMLEKAMGTLASSDE